MYKVLVADDEEYIRKGIITVLSKMGFDMEFFEAGNGEEAFCAIKKNRPEIVLLDIKMPLMSGIEVLENCRRNQINAKFIIISGYSEFDFAQKALNLGADGFVLKPIDPEKIQGILNRTITQINEFKRLDDLGRQKEGLEKEAEIIKIERTINQLLYSPDKVIDKNLNCFEDIPLLKDKLCQLIIFHLDGCNFNIWDKEFKGFEKVKNEVKEILSGYAVADNITVINNQKNIDELFVIITGRQEVGINITAAEFLNSTLQEIRKSLSLSITVAVSEVTDTINESFNKNLRKLLDLRFEKGINKIYKIDDLAGIMEKTAPEEYLKLMAQYISKAEYDSIKTTLKDMFGITVRTSEGIVNVRRLYHEVIGVISGLCANRSIDIMKPPLEVDFTGDILNYLDNKIELVNYLHTTIVNVFNIESYESAKCSNVIDMVVNYVEENYDRQLTVKEIAVQFAMNPNYFSSLFKKKTGYSFIDFINNKKVEAACKMLSLPNTNVTGIAESLGFQDIQYFYKLFKKYKGVTPLEFRKLSLQR